MRRSRTFAGAVLAGLILTCGGAPAAETLELRKSDHICYIGNTLADRMQHHGWLETLIQDRFPKHDPTQCSLADLRRALSKSEQ